MYSYVYILRSITRKYTSSLKYNTVDSHYSYEYMRVYSTVLESRLIGQLKYKYSDYSLINVIFNLDVGICMRNRLNGVPRKLEQSLCSVIT